MLLLARHFIVPFEINFPIVRTVRRQIFEIRYKFITTIPLIYNLINNVIRS